MNYISELRAFDELNENGNYLAGYAQLLWYKLMAIDNKRGWQEWFAVDNATLQAKMHVSENTIHTCRKELIDKKLIQYKRGRKGKPSQYKMISILSLLTSKNEVHIKAQTEVQTEVQTATLYKHKTINNKKDTKVSKKDAMITAIDEYTDSELLKTALQEYIAHRAEIKKPLTQLALTKCLKKLDGAAATDTEKIACIDQSIAQGWTGIFPLKPENQCFLKDENKLEGGRHGTGRITTNTRANQAGARKGKYDDLHFD